jgi:hypothetical protein
MAFMGNQEILLRHEVTPWDSKRKPETAHPSSSTAQMMSRQYCGSA